MSKECIHFFGPLCIYVYIKDISLTQFSVAPTLIREELRHVRPQVSTRRPLDGFAWNFVLETFIKICCENPDLDKTVQKNRVIYVETKYVYIVESRTRHFVPRQQNKENP